MKIRKYNKEYRKHPQPLSQKEICKRLSKATRNSYKYLDLLVWKGAING